MMNDERGGGQANDDIIIFLPAARHSQSKFLRNLNVHESSLLLDPSFQRQPRK